jgi:hypothetical protein
MYATNHMIKAALTTFTAMALPTPGAVKIEDRV